MPISTKVLTQLLVGLAVGILTVLARDASWADGLPVWVAPIATQVIAAAVAWIKRETNPAPSSLGQ